MLQAKDRDAVRSCFSFEFQLCVLISFFFFLPVSAANYLEFSHVSVSTSP